MLKFLDDREAMVVGTQEAVEVEVSAIERQMMSGNSTHQVVRFTVGGHIFSGFLGADVLQRDAQLREYYPELRQNYLNKKGLLVFRMNIDTSPYLHFTMEHKGNALTLHHAQQGSYRTIWFNKHLGRDRTIPRLLVSWRVPFYAGDETQAPYLENFVEVGIECQVYGPNPLHRRLEPMEDAEIVFDVNSFEEAWICIRFQNRAVAAFRHMGGNYFGKRIVAPVSMCFVEISLKDGRVDSIECDAEGC